jgi:hypothetical protein
VSMNDPDYPRLVEVNSHIPPENINVFSEIKSLDLSAPAGASIHQDLGRILCETMPDHNWRIENVLRENRFNLLGSPESNKYLVLVALKVRPSKALSHLASSWWSISKSPFRPSPKQARKILGLPDPEGPVDENDEISPESRMVLIHIFPPDAEKEPGVNEQSEIRAAGFVGAKAMLDTDSRLIYGQTRLLESTLEDVDKVSKVAEVIREIVAKADHVI